MGKIRVQKRRRRENKTDYKLRLNLLKSGVKRIVVRRSNKYFTLQLVESTEAQDKVLKTTSSKDLLKQGFDKKFSGSLKTVAAGYLTGLLFAKDLPKEKFVLDLGMARTIHGNRIFGVVKGLVDGGVEITVNEIVFPSEERINGEHLKDEVKTQLSKLKTKLG
jgi:large subunit ribosomal protein L18